MKGFVNITIDRNSPNDPTGILTNIEAITPGVQFAYLVTGQGVDIIAFVDAPDPDSFRATVLAISQVTGVANTFTNVVL